jgi:hypothetical protein
MDPEMSVDAADLPAGTEIEHSGRLFTAWPGLPRVPGMRWHAGSYDVMSDDAMTAALTHGIALVVGRDRAAVEMYEQVLADCRDPAGR